MVQQWQQCSEDPGRQHQMQPLTIQRTSRHVSWSLFITRVFFTIISVPPQASNEVEALSDSSGSQNVCLKPRLVLNSAGDLHQTDSNDVFNLHSRIYPTLPLIIKEMTTLSPASMRLVATKEGLIGKSPEGRDILGSTHPSNVLLEGPVYWVMHPPKLAPASYDGTNPFVPWPPPEWPLEQLPGPGLGMCLPYSQQPDIGQADSCMQYNMNSHTGWYASHHGPYPPILYMPQHYHPAYPPPNPHGPIHLQTEHPDHNTLPCLHDTYYNDMIGGNDLYHPLYPTLSYPFYPPTLLSHVLAPSPIQMATKTPYLVHHVHKMTLEVTRRCTQRVLI